VATTFTWQPFCNASGQRTHSARTNYMTLKYASDVGVCRSVVYTVCRVLICTETSPTFRGPPKSSTAWIILAPCPLPPLWSRGRGKHICVTWCFSIARNSNYKNVKLWCFVWSYHLSDHSIVLREELLLANIVWFSKTLLKLLQRTH
jgi:hypothetical protein